MAGQMFMRVDEVAEELGVSKPYAYKLIRAMNEELKKTGCITIAGRIDRKFFYEKFYGTRNQNERTVNCILRHTAAVGAVVQRPLCGLSSGRN